MNCGENGSASLFLVGTCHRDPQGFRRCRTLLRALRPDVVLVEVSPFAVRMREAHSRFFVRHFLSHLKGAASTSRILLRDALRTSPMRHILRQCALPFELRAARRWHSESGRPYFCVDDSEASRIFFLDWPELLSSHNLRGLLQSVPRDVGDPAEEYRRARAATAASPWPIPRRGAGTETLLWNRREQWLETTIRCTVRWLRPSRLVYLGGWSHVVSNGGTSLWDRLRDLNPTRLLLDEVDRPELFPH